MTTDTTTFDELTRLPEHQAEQRVRELLHTEERLPPEERQTAIRQRLESWSAMGADAAHHVAALFLAAIEKMEPETAHRLQEATKEAIAKLEPRDRERLQQRLPAFFDRHWPDRFQEDVGGHRADTADAGPGTAVYSSDDQLVGHVDSVWSKYVQVSPGDGESFWLSVSVIQRADAMRVSLGHAKDELPALALTDPAQLEAGLDAPDPGMHAQIDPRGDEEDQEARRKGLVRGNDADSS